MATQGAAAVPHFAHSCPCTKAPVAWPGRGDYMLAQASIVTANIPVRREGFSRETVLHARQLQHAQFGRLFDAHVHEPCAAPDGGPVWRPGADFFAMDHPGGAA